MEREAKTAKPRAGAKTPAAKRSRPRPVADGRSVEQRLADALAQQAATSAILRVMAESPNDVQPVLDAVAEQACHLCHSPFARIFLVEGDALRPAANHSVEGETSYPVHPVPLRRTSVTGRATLDCVTIHHADVVPLLDTTYPDARENAMESGIRAFLAVPLMRNGAAYGTILLWRREPGLFAPDQVALVETFATQAAIAIANVQLFDKAQAGARDLAESLRQQTATNEVLKAISRSTFDLGTVLHTLVESAARLCEADHGSITRQKGRHFYRAEFYGFPTEFIDYVKNVPVEAERGSATGRVLLEGRVIHIPDVLADPDYTFVEARKFADFRTILGVPIMREGSAIGVLALTRTEALPFTGKQIELVSTFADQAAIAIENVRLFSELEVRNRDLTELLEQQTATSDILRVISQSPTDVQPVFDTIAGAAMALCGANSSNVFIVDGYLIRLAALTNKSPEAALAVRRSYPRPIGRDNGASRAVLTRGVVVIPDILEDPEYGIAPTALAAGFRSVLSVPLLHDGEPIGAIAVGRPEPGPFPDSQIALLQTFADQAVIAIENVRLFNETKEALDRQTATADILKVISSSPTDTQPIFDAIVESAMRLCNPVYSTALRLEGELIHLVAQRNWSGEGLAMAHRLFPMPLGQDHLTAHAIRESRIIHVTNLQSDPGVPASSRELAIAQGYQALLIVPMLRDERAIGAIVVANADVPFSDKHVQLLQTFADQAVIAVENVRLFNELEARNRALTEALEQQTATSEILRVISQSQTDVQPVFDTIAKAARELCDATSANVFTYDGELVHVAATENANLAYVKALRNFFPRPPSRDTGVQRAILARSVVTVPDVLADPEYVIGEHAAAGGFRSVLAVPLIREGEAIGGIAVGRVQPGSFPDSHVTLLQTFADQALIAIENVRLFRELETRTTELTRSVGELKALGEVGQAVSSTLDLETVLSTIVSRATQLAGMSGGSIYEYDEDREEFHLRAADNLPDDLIAALRATPIRKGEGALGQMASTGEPVQIRDIMDEGSYQSRVRAKLLHLGYRALLVVPLMRDDHLLGGLAVNRKNPGEFDSEVIALLKTFATQSALAIQNARLFREIEVKGRQLEVASQHKSEFLANMSHELRTPLNAIIGFSEVLSERLFGELNDKQAEYAGDITESGRHLLSLINDILDLSKIEAGRMELEISEFDLATAIENTLTLVRERAQRRCITLSCTSSGRVLAFHADERKVKQVLLNLLSNALKFTPEGGKVDVHTTAHVDRVEIAVKDTGVGIAPEDQDAVFEEFRQVGAASKKIEGTGLGLAISRKFIELHGGRIWVTSELGAGSTFAFTLPLR